MTVISQGPREVNLGQKLSADRQMRAGKIENASWTLILRSKAMHFQRMRNLRAFLGNGAPTTVLCSWDSKEGTAALQKC